METNETEDLQNEPAAMDTKQGQDEEKLNEKNPGVEVEVVNPNSEGTVLLTAFKSGIQETLSLVQHMSDEQKAEAWETLVNLFSQTSNSLKPSDTEMLTKTLQLTGSVDGVNTDSQSKNKASLSTPTKMAPPAVPAPRRSPRNKPNILMKKATVTQKTQINHQPEKLKSEKETEDESKLNVKKHEIDEVPDSIENEVVNILQPTDVEPLPTEVTELGIDVGVNIEGLVENIILLEEGQCQDIIVGGGELDEEHLSEHHYSCDDCSKTFAKEELLKEHMETHSDKQFQCDLCQKSFSLNSNLKRHKMQVHQKQRPYVCEFCNKGFFKKNLFTTHLKKQHEEEIVEKYLDVPDIESRFDEDSSLDLAKLCNVLTDEEYSCSTCFKMFCHKFQLLDHYNKEHAGESMAQDERLLIKEDEERSLKDETEAAVDSLQTYTCGECGKDFNWKANLKAHMVIHQEEKPFDCETCGRTFSFRNNLTRHKMIHTGLRPHKCEHCNRKFIEKKSLVFHLARIHPESRPEKVLTSYVCTLCGKSFASSGSLYQHSFVHTGQKPYKCDVCGKDFSLKSNMKRHIKTHSGEKPWKCSECGQGFTEKRSMEVHRRQHTGERPYKCELCGKGFAQPGTLQSHMPVHTGARNLLCTLCGASFLRKSHLNFHMQKHNSLPKHQCGECQMEFYRKGDLARHEQTHSGTKPYPCDICNKSFTRPHYLKDHKNSHTGNKPYKCKQCDETFTDGASRLRHMRQVHKAKGKKRRKVDSLMGGNNDEVIVKRECVEGSGDIPNVISFAIVTPAPKVVKIAIPKYQKAKDISEQTAEPLSTASAVITEVNGQSVEPEVPVYQVIPSGEVSQDVTLPPNNAEALLQEVLSKIENVENIGGGLGGEEIRIHALDPSDGENRTYVLLVSNDVAS